MSGMLREGEWVTKSDWKKSGDGSFQREPTTFRDPVTDVAPGRYHLYVSYACPWACRTLMVRALKGLEGAISVSVVHPFMGDDGWAFDPDEPRCDADPIHGARFLREVYLAADPKFTGRVTVPVLWDREEETIANNESSDIIRFFDRDFHELAVSDLVLYPESHKDRIDEVMEAIYQPINNGVYRCGFAGSQAAYDRAFAELFEALDHYDALLSNQRYLCGDRLTLADVCMFTTLVRFDPVYYVHFKCNGRLIADYDNLSGYLRELYQLPGVADTVSFDHIKRHYYRSHRNINPTQIVAGGPRRMDLSAPHGRGHL
jgi:putative glutathione S-transferase